MKDGGHVNFIRFGEGSIACLYLDAQGDDFGQLAGRMRLLHDLCHVDHGATFELISAITASPSGDLMHSRIEDILGLSRVALPANRVTAALQRMRVAPGAMHSLQSLAASASLSPSRFLHLFKSQTGVPLRRFRVWNRMGAALAVVGCGGSLTAAAHRAGFSSSAHFSTAFRRMFGFQPSALIKAKVAISVQVDC